MNTRLFRLGIGLLTVIAVLLPPAGGAIAQPSHPGSASIQPGQAARPSRPSAFAPNVGQFDPQVRYQLRGAGGMWRFTDDALWLTVLDKPAPGHAGTLVQPKRELFSSLRSRSGTGGESLPQRGVHLKLTFPGMSPEAHWVAADLQPGTMNYLLGNDTIRWQRHVPTYGSLRWEGLYPGLTLTFGRTRAGLGLTVAAGSDAALSALRLRVEGADGVWVDAQGRLVADTALGPVVLPTLQTGDGSSLCPVGTGEIRSFTRSTSASAADAPAPSDTATDLLSSTYLGGSGGDVPLAMALGTDGSVYATGFTESSDFPITPGAFDTHLHGQNDVFVSRMSADGSTLLFSTYLGGRQTENAWGLVLGSSGTVYVAGGTTSVDFPTTSGAYDTTCETCNKNYADGFVTQLSADGSSLVYSTFLGGRRNDVVVGIALGSDGSAYLTGFTEGSGFPTTPGAYDPTCNSCPELTDSFITHLSADGSSLLYSTFLGGNNYDCGGYDCYIAVGSDGSAYVTGGTCSSDFPTTPGAFDTTYNGSSAGCGTADQGDVYVSKLSADGSTLLYSTYVGGSSDEYSHGIVLGGDGSVYVAGITYSSDFPTTPGAFDPTCNNCPNGDGVVFHLDAAGSTLLYSTYLSGSTGSVCLGIAVGSDGAAYVTGDTSSGDFPVTANAYDTTCGTDGKCNFDGTFYHSDAFLTKLSADGSSLLYSTFLGGSADDVGYVVAIDSSGAGVIVGNTDSSDFPTTPGAYDTSLTGNLDLFISHLSPGLVSMHVGYIKPFYRLQGSSYLVAARVAIQDANKLPVAGATVTVQLTQPDGSQATLSGTTNTGGLATVKRSVSLSGTYTFTVTSVVKYGWLYEPALNKQTSASITIP